MPAFYPRLSYWQFHRSSHLHGAIRCGLLAKAGAVGDCDWSLSAVSCDWSLSVASRRTMTPGTPNGLHRESDGGQS